ncbi:52 kDa repressor of the inhibitor of the protein kinase-like [Branchiostoma floridae x Branchiostoma belcheri]
MREVHGWLLIHNGQWHYSRRWRLPEHPSGGTGCHSGCERLHGRGVKPAGTAQLPARLPIPEGCNNELVFKYTVVLACITCYSSNCLELCGRQGLALRGHRDDSTADPLSIKGNFHALLQPRVDAGDEALKDHLDRCARNATYVSKTSQNQLLDCMKQYIQDTIVHEIDNQEFGAHFGIMADEVTEVSNWEQLGLLVRYTKDGKPVERLLLFAACEEITGRALCDTIVGELRKVRLDPANCRAQCFDGAGNMAGVRNGCAANFKRTAAPRAPYFHCASHDLNLALCKACKVQDIQCMLETLKIVGIFFKYSPKRQRELEKGD